MRLHSLRARIAFVFVVMMLLVQAGGYVAINSVIDRNARKNIKDQLLVAERVFRQVLAGDGEKLTQASSVIASDFGFRQAVATRDDATVASALQNYGGRINADVVMLVGLDGKLIATQAGPAANHPAFGFPSLIAAAAASGQAASTGLINGHAYDLVAVPVKAPVAIAWVVMGFVVDDKLAAEMARLTSLDVSFLHQRASGQWTVLATSRQQRSPAVGKMRAAAAPSGTGLSVIDDGAWSADDSPYISRAVPIATTGAPMIVLLQRSKAEAMAGVMHLHELLLSVTLIGVLISVAGSLFIARSVTRPLAVLSQFSQRIASGDYAEPLVETSKDEIGALAGSFNLMQQGIAERERRISELAFIDVLTGLPNRAMFTDQLGRALAVAGRAEHPVSVMTMDLDRFKYVNDALGHPGGDQLLCEVARRLELALPRETDLVARLGGDEFAVMLPASDLAGAKVVAARILKALEVPTVIEGQLVDIGASIGIVTYPRDGNDMDVLMRHADIAMYTAKRLNSGYALYDEKHELNSALRLSLMGELRQAVEHDQLTLYYQPKVDLATQRVKYVEALVRWIHPTRGFIAPDEFIPFAEQTGYIKTISRWVANKAIAQSALWRAQGIDLAISVNVSARELIQSTLPEIFGELLTRHGVPAHAIWIEVTESAIMDDPNHAIETLDRLHAMGIRISIDDFGTGYSSLTYLKRMPVDELKIDKSFVMGMSTHKDDETIVRSTINLGHNMGLKVVAEGVETEEMLEQLRVLGCDLAQGYHISRPLPPEKLETWLQQWSGNAAVVAVAEEATEAAVAAVASEAAVTADAAVAAGVAVAASTAVAAAPAVTAVPANAVVVAGATVAA